MVTQQIEMMGRQIDVDISQRARQQLTTMDTTVFIEMELYFSCLIRKQLRVRESLDELFSVSLTENLHIGFRPVMTKACSVSSCEGDKPPLSDFPIKNPQAYIPRWLKLDYKKGEWCGDFGY